MLAQSIGNGQQDRQAHENREEDANRCCQAHVHVADEERAHVQNHQHAAYKEKVLQEL